MRLRIGTRKSRLALWQAEFVSVQLQAAGLDTQIIPIETIGDKVLETAISKIGSKGVFTQEIEEGLRVGEIDLAVHSAKDMPSELPEEFGLIAFTEREKPNDVLVMVSETPANWDYKVVIGTSSTRRCAFLKRYFPNSNQVDMRGNLQTRVKKMEAGHCDALMLAYAGAHRMGLDHLIRKELSLEEFTPPAGQGSIAVEVNLNLDANIRSKIRAAVNNPQSESCILAERGFLKAMQGGCSVPVFSLAQPEGEGIAINAGIISLDGSTLLRERAWSEGDPETLGATVAEKVLNRGGDRILAQIKGQLGN